MFREELREKLRVIFGIEKVTFNAPSDSFEQDTLFVEIADCKSRTTQGKAYAKVTGSLVIYSQENKLPYGFFNKKISQSRGDLARNFFFTEIDRDIEASNARMVNLHERRTGFVYLYSAQYDPNQGQIEGFETTAEFAVKLLDVGDGSNVDIGDGKLLEV